MNQRYKIIIVDRWQRYRKVTRKGGIHNRKWRPMMVPVQISISIGALAHERAVACSGQAEPYFNAADPTRPRIMEFTPKLWRLAQKRRPEFAAMCDLFCRVEVMRDGVPWIKDAPYAEIPATLISRP